MDEPIVAANPADQWMIVGAGRAGLTLAVALASHGLGVDLVCRRGTRRERLVAWLAPLGLPITVCETAGPANHVILAVPDGAIVPVAATLPVFPGSVWLHLSGAQPWAILQRSEGPIDVGALHPLAALPDPLDFAPSPAVLRPLHGATCAISGTPTAQAHARYLALLVKGRPVTVREDARALYHAAAALAANDLVGLLALASQAAQEAGLSAEESRQGLTHLMQTALDAVVRLPLNAPLAQGLTGAVARGDAGTLARHLQALRPLSPESVAVHTALSRVLVEEVRSADLLGEAALTAMEAVLAD